VAIECAITPDYVMASLDETSPATAVDDCNLQIEQALLPFAQRACFTDNTPRCTTPEL